MNALEVVLISLERWDDVWRRNQYLVDGVLGQDLASRVLFVEPPRDGLHDLLHGRAFGRGLGLRRHEAYGERLHLFQPTKYVPRLFGATADALLRHQVRSAVRQVGMRHPVLWVNDANGAGLVRSTRWPAVYDITDDWLAAARPHRELARLRRNEDVLFRTCREIVVCSAGLAASRGKRRSVHLIPNAVSVSRYRVPTERPHDLPHGCAVYVGTIHEDRLDVELVVRTAHTVRASGGSVVLVGPDALSAAHRGLLLAAGVRILGARSFSMVPAYLQHADALIVPHVVDAFTDSLDPIKLYEYLAVGRRIVSTPVAGFRESDADGLLVVDSTGFPAAVAAAVAHPGATITRADVPDWSDRVAAMITVLDAVRRGAPPGPR